MRHLAPAQHKRADREAGARAGRPRSSRGSGPDGQGTVAVPAVHPDLIPRPSQGSQSTVHLSFLQQPPTQGSKSFHERAESAGLRKWIHDMSDTETHP